VSPRTRRWHRATAAVAGVLAIAVACAPPDGAGDRALARAERVHPEPGRWSEILPDWPFTMAADDAGAFVVVADDLLAVDPVDGTERWRVPVGRTVFFDPALDRDTVVVSTEERFVALDRSTGTRRWDLAVGEHPSSAAIAATDGGPVALLPTEAGSVVAVDLATGAVRWSTRFEGRLDGPPAVGAGIAAFTWHDMAAPALRALDVATGAVVWEAAIGVSSSAPAVAGDVVVTGEGDGRYAARVVGRDLATGAERWSVPVPASFEPGLIPGVRGDDVAVTDHFGTVTMVDARSGRVRWQHALELGVLRTKVFVTAGAVVLGTFSGRVAVLDRDTGRALSREHPGGFPSGLAVARGRVLLALRLTEPPRLVARPVP
jgi:outer membrane protein assembly factor BamB